MRKEGEEYLYPSQREVEKIGYARVVGESGRSSPILYSPCTPSTFNYRSREVSSVGARVQL